MKKIYAIAFTSLALVSATQAQTLLSGQFPEPGFTNEYILADTLGIVPGSGGISQIWNFEDLNLDTVTQMESYLPPIVTNPVVPGHTTVTGDINNGYSFFKRTPSDFTMVAISDSANANVSNYSNAMTLMTFPFSYNSNFTDSFAFTGNFGGTAFDAMGTINATADGTGNLLLASGAFNNVLRVKTTVVTNATVLVFAITQTQEIYEWYDGIYPFPLLHIEMSTTSDPFGGAPTMSKNVWVKKVGPAGLNSKTSNLDFSIYPNPTKDIVQVKLNNANNTKLTISNALGQVVYQNNAVTSNLSNLSISTSDLAKGVYFVTLTQDNKTTTKKLVVE